MALNIHISVVMPSSNWIIIFAIPYAWQEWVSGVDRVEYFHVLHFHTDNIQRALHSLILYIYCYHQREIDNMLNAHSFSIDSNQNIHAMVCSHVQCLWIRCSLGMFVNESSIIFERFDSIKSKDVFCFFFLHWVLQFSFKLSFKQQQQQHPHRVKNSHNINIFQGLKVFLFVFCLLLSSDCRNNVSLPDKTWWIVVFGIRRMVKTIDKRID